MTYTLRTYQKESVNAAISWIKKSTEPAVMELFTAAGKSLILAEIARIITTELAPGKKVLVLQPSKELLEQNSSKYRMTGEKFSLFSASVGQKSIRHNVVFATPLTLKNHIDKIASKFCAVLIDECDLITDSIINIINSIRKANPKVRVIGVTASPWKLSNPSGFIYNMNIDDKPTGNDKAFFHKLIFRVPAQYLYENGFITKPVMLEASDHYNTSNLDIKNNQYTHESLNRAFVGYGRKTALIVEEIVRISQSHKTVMIFAANVAHAKEIMASLPPEISAMIDGETKKTEREAIIKKAKNGNIKYLVSVETLTTGVDIESVSVIAILRPTLSTRLLVQIIGRGCRLYPGKKECLVLDYTTTNMELHFPDGDLLNPKIYLPKKKKDETSTTITCTCPDCHSQNEFLARPNPDGYGYHKSGYFSDLEGFPLEIPSHYGRRCSNWHISKIDGKAYQCSYRYIGKDCEKCGSDNDISAIRCISCGAELVNPNDSLVFEKPKAAKVISWNISKGKSKNGNDYTKVDFILENGKVVPVWYPHLESFWAQQQYRELKKHTEDLTIPPLEIEYRKNNKDYYNVVRYVARST